MNAGGIIQPENHFIRRAQWSQMIYQIFQCASFAQGAIAWQGSIPSAYFFQLGIHYFFSVEISDRCQPLLIPPPGLIHLNRGLGDLDGDAVDAEALQCLAPAKDMASPPNPCSGG